MSLFGSKRRRPPNPSLASNTVHSDATTAALSAFSSLDRRQSTPSLSEAAAAAALKARPHTPTDVSSVVPRRRSRRAGSKNSSRGTASPRPAPRRSLSSGSMGERTFRSPSPHGRQPMNAPGTNGNGVAEATGFDGAPPVPSIPAGVQAPQTSQQQKQPQRTGSLRIAAQPVRVASQKMKDGAQGTWFGAPAVGDLANTRTSDAALDNALTHESQQPGERPESRSSVNFSYPARQRLGSSPTSPLIEEASLKDPPRQRKVASDTGHDGPVRTRNKRSSAVYSPPNEASARQRQTSMPGTQELVYDPNSRRMVPKAELLALEHMFDEVGPRQTHKQKKPTRAGSHLAKGTLGRTQGSAISSTRSEAAGSAAGFAGAPTAVANDQVQARSSISDNVPTPVASPPVGARREPAPSKGGVEEAVPRSRRYVKRLKGQDFASTMVQPEPQAQPETKTTSHPLSLGSGYQERTGSPPTTKQPAVPEVISEQQPAPASSPLNDLDSVMSRQHVQTRPERATAVSNVDNQQAVEQSQSMPLKDSPAGRPSEAETNGGKGILAELQSTHHENLRSQSMSPVRVAHFGPVQRTLSVRHSPPPRSISPRKSAMKHYTSPRNSSPRDGSSADDASDIGSAPLPGEPVQRRKSARVSFDDQEIVLDASESSDAGTQQVESPKEDNRAPTSQRRKWFGNITKTKRANASFDEEEVMKPRPALPSFGSVRGEKKKHGGDVERPLVRPSEATYSPSLPDSPSMQSQPGTVTDRAIASVLASDYALKFPANTSRYREPLPPVVTSREGGYLSMSEDSSSESDLESLRNTPALSTQLSTATTVLDVEAEELSTKQGTTIESSQSAPVPTIAITEPSPRSPREPSAAIEKLVVPGGFPEDESDGAMHTEPSGDSVMHHANASIARQKVGEPLVQSIDSVTNEHTPATVAATTSPVLGDSDSEGTSIYSDAYEDLSDIDEHGFQSIDAVVESPISATGSRRVDRPEELSTKAHTGKGSGGEAVDGSARVASPVDDWEAAKAYWRSLTAEKRAQLESEATEEAGADADLEQEARDESKKPRRKKSVEKRQAEKQAILKAHRDPERVYMIKPGTKVPNEVAAPSSSILRRSMRQQAPEDAAATSAGTNSHLRKSMRTSTPASELAAQPHMQQPRAKTASGGPTQAAPGAAHRAHNVVATASPTATAPPPRTGTMSSFFPPVLKRRGSTSSESSFRRSTAKRAPIPSRAAEPSGFSLRRTMRRSSAEQAESPSGNKRFSLRSFSPQDSLRSSHVASPPPVTMNGSRMRTSLRDAGGRSKMGIKSGGSAIHLPSFGRKSKTKGKEPGSRFDDSSDEDGTEARGFRSRFEDSSDEDAAPAPQTHVGGLGVKTMRTGKTSAAVSSTLHTQEPLREEDSPDLPDSSEDEVAGRVSGAAVSMRDASANASRPTWQASNAGGAQPLRRSGSGRGSLGGAAPALGTSLMRNGNGSGRFGPESPQPSSPTNRRGSFMSAVLGRRKPSAPSSPIQRGELMDSAARRDTALERSPGELAAMRGGKLQRRTTAPAVSAGEWPLAAAPVDPRRPGVLKASRRSMSFGDGVVGDSGDGTFAHGDKVNEVAPVRDEPLPLMSKPKKKFGVLRRIFRLDD